MNKLKYMSNNTFKKGDIVTRLSHRNDILFKIASINNDNCILYGVDLRIIADSPVADLVISNKINVNEFDRNDTELDKLNITDYFYIPGKILHIDSDKEYLEKCLNYYKDNHVLAYGKYLKANDISNNIVKLLIKYKPDLLVITGHDSYKGNNTYTNSYNYINAVIEARKYEKNMNNLVIIAGACQSDYVGLMKAGATFASSPGKINIHVLDPAIIAVNICLSDRYKEINLTSILSKTKYGKNGIGGIKCEGLMKIGYPRVGEK